MSVPMWTWVKLIFGWVLSSVWAPRVTDLNRQNGQQIHRNWTSRRAAAASPPEPTSVTVCVLAGGGAGAIPGGAADSGGSIVVKDAWCQAFVDLCNILLFISVGGSLSEVYVVVSAPFCPLLLRDRCGRTLEKVAFLHLQKSCFYFEG